MRTASLLLAFPLLALAQDISGEWHGAIEVQNDAPLRLALHISPGNSPAATIDSIDEGEMAVPVDSVAISGSTIKLDMKGIGGSFEGKIEKDGSRIVGSWSQSGGAWPLVWERGEDPGNSTQVFDAREAARKGRTCTQWFYSGQLSELWRQLSPVLRQDFGAEAGLRELRDRIRQEMGAEIKLTDENVRPDGMLQVYRRLARFDRAEAEVRIAFDFRGAVAGFSIQAVSNAGK